MPEFVLRYRAGLRKQALVMAKELEAVASEIFGWDVSWEAKKFGDSSGFPHFSVTGWVTDNDDELKKVVRQVQKAVLQSMQEQAFADQSVECWWQRVKGKWSGAVGLKTRP